MEWQQIIGFYYVAKLGSFTRAAEATYRTQSALTQQVKAIEEEFDSELFERVGKRKLVLTPVGERFFEFCESVILQYRQLNEDIAEHKQLNKGLLKVAAPFTTLYHLLPKIINKYNKEFPWVELSLLDRSQNEVVELTRSGDIDFGIALEKIIPSGLNKQRWKIVEPVLLTQSGHPLLNEKTVSLEKIAQYPLILPPKTAGFPYRNEIEELFREKRLKYFVIMESSNIELSSLYVEMGLGVSFASIAKGVAVFENRKLDRISLNHFLKSDYICIISREGKKITKFQNAFLEMLFDSGHSENPDTLKIKRF